MGSREKTHVEGVVLTHGAGSSGGTIGVESDGGDHGSGGGSGTNKGAGGEHCELLLL